MLSYSFYESDARVRQYTTSLVERGDEVEVIALRRNGLPSRDSVDGVSVCRVQKRNRNERGQLGYALKQLLFLIRSTIVLGVKHLRKPYDLVHVHNVPDFMVFAALLPKLTGTPVILDIHDILPEFYASKFKTKRNSITFKFCLLVERISAAFADHVLVANHIWHERLILRSVRSQKCTPICNYPDPQLFHSYSKTRSDTKFIIMYPGTLNWHQGVDIAIRAFARITDQIPDAEFHIYGEGPAKDSLMRLAKLLGLDGRVRFREFLPTHEIAQIMANADLAVVPKRDSLFGREAQSTKILEFMAVGVPVIAPRVKITCAYHDDSRLKLFRPGDETDLAESILLLKNDEALRNRLVSNATKHIETHNWSVKKREYLDLVDSLIQRQKFAHQGEFQN